MVGAMTEEHEGLGLLERIEHRLAHLDRAVRELKRDGEHKWDLLEGHTLDVLRRVKRMAITQEQFDADLAAVLAAEQANGEAVGTLVTAVEAALAAKPAADLTAEDEAVRVAAAEAGATAQALADELAKLNPAA
jgi:hypothetical protein